MNSRLLSSLQVLANDQHSSVFFLVRTLEFHGYVKTAFSVLTRVQSDEKQGNNKRESFMNKWGKYAIRMHTVSHMQILPLTYLESKPQKSKFINNNTCSESSIDCQVTIHNTRGCHSGRVVDLIYKGKHTARA